MRCRRTILLSGLLAGLLCTSGCILPPVFKSLDNERVVLATRYDARSNVVEQIVQKETVGDFYSMNVEPPSGVLTYYWNTRFEIERPHQKNIPCESLEAYRRGKSRYSWFPHWHLRPISETNLWLALSFAGNKPYGGYGTNKWDTDVGLRIYVFNSKTFLSTNQVTAFAPRGCHGFPELWLDSSGRHLVYKTKDGYESYDVLNTSVTSVEQISENPPLTLKDFGIFDSGPPAGGYPEDRPD